MDTIKIKTYLKLEVLDKDGNLLSKWEGHNLTTNIGKALFAAYTGNLATLSTPYLALGSSATAPTVLDTTLGTEWTTIGLSRAAPTVSRVTTLVTNDTIQFYHSFTATGIGTINEVGLFDTSPSGNLLGHALTSSTSVVNTNVVNMTYQIQFT